MTTAPTAPTAEPLTPADNAARAPRPNGPGHPATTRTYKGLTPGDWAIRIVLGLVMTAALAVGTWSIYTLLTHQLAAPQPIAFLGCGMFDVAALFFALLSQRYAVTTDSGLAPRTAMLAMICTSSWINWQHGQMEGWGTVGSVILAAAPVIAELAFEMFHRYAHREALRRLGRVAQALPVLGKWAWIFHPHRARRALDAHIRAALTEHEAVAERREEVASERARILVSAHAQQAPALTDTAHAHPEPALTAGVERPALSAHTAAAVPAQAAERPVSAAPVRPALTPAALTDTVPERPSGAQPPADATPERTAPAHAAPAHDDTPQTERLSAPSLAARKALMERQDAITLTLYRTLNGRPEWTEIRRALADAGLGSVSRPTAQRIRERVENAHPDLPRERRQPAAND